MSQNNGGGNGQQEKRQSSGRSGAEWTTLSISTAILLILIGLISYQYLAGSNQPAHIEVRPQLQQVRQAGDRYYLPVEVTNTGDKTAEDVRVGVSLTSAGSGKASSQLRFMFLAGHETSRGTVVFKEDPSKGDLSVDAVSFLQP